MGDRIGMEIGIRDFKFGDPYYKCPECGDDTYFNERGGACYTCEAEFLIMAPPEEGEQILIIKPSHLLAAGVAVALGVLLVRKLGHGKR